MKAVIKYLFSVAVFYSAAVLAHGDVKLTDVSPSQGTALASPPEVLSLTYSKPIRLIKVTLSNETQGAIDFGFAPVSSKQPAYTWDLPALKPDTYTVEWIAMGSDGHKIKKAYSFTVK